MVALAGAERHVHAVGIAPLGDDVAVAHHQPADPTTRSSRSDDRAERPLAPILLGQVGEDIALPGRLVLLGEADGCRQPVGIEAGLLWLAALPPVASIWEVGRVSHGWRPLTW
jgi:hypothetical protein